MDKIKKIQAEKDEANRIATEESNWLHARLDKELSELYDLLKKNLMEVDGETIGKYKVSVEECGSRFKLFVNEYHLATLKVERRSHRCGHDYQCDCPTTYYHNVDVKTHSTRDGDSGVYFNCTSKQDFEADMFPAAILSLIERYDYRNF